MISKKVRIPLYGGSLFVMIANDYEKQKNELHKDWKPDRSDFIHKADVIRWLRLITEKLKSKNK